MKWSEKELFTNKTLQVYQDMAVHLGWQAGQGEQ